MSERRWYKLDNSAKIIPSMTNSLNTFVFRLTCELKETIDRDILKFALEETCKEFPLFLCTIKYGIFWRYLESTKEIPTIEEDHFNPCSKLDNNQLFRVTYYKKRINLDVYHVLTDGSGALEFLKYLVACYLDRAHGLNMHTSIIKSSIYAKESDDFLKFARKNTKLTINKNKKALKLKFPRKETTVHDIVEIHMSTHQVKEMAHHYDTTVTVYLAANLIASIIECSSLKDLERPIGITIPIDLRNIFPSETIRNFFYSLTIQYKSDGKLDIEKIIDFLKGKFKEVFSKENVQNLLDSYIFLEKSILVRIMPYFIKWPIASLIVGQIKKSTMTLSNVGVIKLPECYEKYIESFIGLMSSNGLHLTTMSYRDDLSLGFTTHYLCNEVERNLVKRLQEDGIQNISIVSNKRK